MRIVFSGASPLTVTAARVLIKVHEVIIIEKDKKKIDELSEEMDCSFLHGDATTPGILKEVNPETCDFLFCLCNEDQTNIITSLLGRSLGFKRVVTNIEQPELEQMCREIGLEDIIIPVQATTRHLENMIKGLDQVDISSVLKFGTRLFTINAGSNEAVTIEELKLPESTRIIFYYRNETLHFVNENIRFKKGDEIIVLCNTDTLPELIDRYSNG